MINANTQNGGNVTSNVNVVSTGVVSYPRPYPYYPPYLHGLIGHARFKELDF